LTAIYATNPAAWQAIRTTANAAPVHAGLAKRPEGLTGSPEHTSSTHGKLSSAQANSPQAKKLVKAATEFESMLISSWWSAMKEGGLPGGEDDSDPGKETLDQLGMQAMSAAVAKGGGFGIGAMLVHSLLFNVGDVGKVKSTGEAPAPSTPTEVSAGGSAG